MAPRRRRPEPSVAEGASSEEGEGRGTATTEATVRSAAAGTYAVFIACALAGCTVHAALQLYPAEVLRLCRAVSLPAVLVVFVVLILPKRHTCTSDDIALIIIRAMGLAKHEQIVYESCIAFSSWSLSYVFVRRLLNPETHSSALTDKFTMDAFFGGLANAFACYMKYHITNMKKRE